MSKNFSVIGGDLRIVKLVQMLAKDGNMVYTYGLEKAEEIKEKGNIILCNNINETIRNDTKIVIGPIPFSSDGEKINSPFSDKKILIKQLMDILYSKVFIAGSIGNEMYNIVNNQNTQIIDIMKREEIAIFNSIATAEGAIEVAIANTNKNLHGSEALILGFGRISKVLAKKMEGLSVNVTCAARKSEDIAWIKTYGYNAENINELGKNLSKYDIIINTVPHIILTKERLNYVKEECLLIDLASKPGGVDTIAAKERNLKFIWALALPGKVAPTATAEFIKEAIYDIKKCDQI